MEEEKSHNSNIRDRNQNQYQLDDLPYKRNNRKKEWKVGNNRDDSGSDSDSDMEFGIPRWQGNRGKTSEIGDFKYLGGERVKSKDFPISLISVFMIGAPSLLYLIMM